VNDIHQSEREQFRVVLIRPDSREVLVAGEQGRFVLPAVQIPRHTRHAEQITAAIASLLNLESYCLFTVPADSQPRATHHYAFACTTVGDASPPDGFGWVSAHLLSNDALGDVQDLLASQSGFEVIRRCQRDPQSGYFGRPAWLHEIMDWSGRQLGPLRLRLTGEYCQWNASSTTCLLRLATDASPVWFKAVGEVSAREFPITLYLAQQFPAHVPVTIAKRDDCNGWLAEEAIGSHPDARSSDQTWIRVADSLAELQVASIGHILQLAEAGCRDVRSRSLVESVQPFLEAMDELMEEQTKISPAPVTRAELKFLENILFDAISSVDELDIPAALGHLDFNPGNIIAGPDRIVFLDWAAASVGSPFLTLEYLLERLHTFRPSDHTLRTEVFTAYARRWRSHVGSDELAVALAATPLLAVFSYASFSGAWCDPARLRDPVTSGHLRSLTRRMKREAEHWVSDPQSIGSFPQKR